MLDIKSNSISKVLKTQDNLVHINRNFSGYGIGDYIYIICDVLLEREETPTLQMEGSQNIHLFFNGDKHDYDISTREIVVNPNGYIRINGFPNWDNYTLNGYFDCELYLNYNS